MNIYNAHMRLLPFLWFSMRLGMINSFLIVCFKMVQKNIQIGEYLQNSCKILHNGYKTTFTGKCITFTINMRENFTNYFSHHSIDKAFCRPGVGQLQWLLYTRIW